MVNYCRSCHDDLSGSAQHCAYCGTPTGVAPVLPGVRFDPLRGWAVAVFVTVAVVAVIDLAVTLMFAALWVFPQAAGVVDTVHRGVLAAYVAAFLACAVAVVTWTYRAFRNLDAIPGASQEVALGWAVAGWLVPLVNLVVPYRVMANVARDSLGRLSTPAAVIVWWTSWVAWSLSSYAGDAETLAALTLWAVVSTILSATAGAALVVVVWRVTRAQQERLEAGWRLAYEVAVPVGGPGATIEG